MVTYINFLHENERTLNLSAIYIFSSSYIYVFMPLLLQQVKINQSEAVNPKSQMLLSRKAICYWDYLSYPLTWEKKISLRLHDCRLYLWTSKWLISNCTLKADLATSHSEYSSNRGSPLPHVGWSLTNFAWEHVHAYSNFLKVVFQDRASNV